jgi:outer membrane protein assembly factor BamA
LDADLAGKVNGLRYFVEGVAVEVRDVSFPGVTPEQAAKLTVAGQRLLKMPFQHSTADDFAAYNFRPILQRMGYLKPTFGKLSVKLVSEDAKKPAVAVSIPVNPGMQYRLGALRWSGNTAFPATELQTFLRARVGAPMDLPGMLEDLAKVNTAYTSHGYLRQSTEEIPSYDDSVQMVSYELRVREGDQYKFEDVTFTGVERAVQDKLRELWTMREGEPYNPGYWELWTMREGEPYNPGYFMTFRQSAVRLLGPGMITKADLQIDDRHKTVALTIAVSFQKREP